jgi:exopolysaccharide biosynthesis polyprenyl glycosylphosphotransferase
MSTGPGHPGTASVTVDNAEGALDSRNNGNGGDPDLGAPRARRSRRAQAIAVARPLPRFGRPDTLMARIFGQHLSPELLGLWLVEVLACSLLLYVLLAYGINDPAAAGTVHVANQAAALALTFGFTSAAVGLYSPDVYLRTRGLLLSTAVGAALAFPLIWLVAREVGIDVAGLPMHGGRLALKALCAWTLLLFGLRFAFSHALRADLFVRRVLIVGADASAARIAAAIRSLRRGFFEVAEVVSADDAEALAPQYLRKGRVWGVIVTADACERLEARQVLRASERGLRMYSDIEFWERQLRRIDVDQVGIGQVGIEHAGAPIGDDGEWQPATRGRLDAAGQRLTDIVLSLALLVLTLPLMLLTAAVIRLDSRGPVLYRQVRVGLHGRPFTVLKFRSMRTDAEARGPVWAMQRDPRVTRIGSFMRLTRIDELPQLINVLRGEMSFIGPRPERPHFVEQLERVLPFYRDRALVKPGLTGWAQVNYPYGASVEDARAKLSYDLYYVKHRSLLLDLLILVATVRVVLFQRGAR